MLPTDFHCHFASRMISLLHPWRYRLKLFAAAENVTDDDVCTWVAPPPQALALVRLEWL